MDRQLGRQADGLRAVRAWREDGLAVYLTLDAGPNPHLLCRAADAPAVMARAEALAPAAELICNQPGPGVTLVDEHLV